MSLHRYFYVAACMLMCVVSSAELFAQTEFPANPPQTSPELLSSLYPPNRIGLGIGYNGATSGGSYPGSMLSGLYARRINAWLEFEATLGYFVGTSQYSDQFYNRANVPPGTGSVPIFQRPVLDAFVVGDVAANFRPFSSGFLSLLSAGVGVSLRGINSIHLANYYVLPAPLAGGQTTLVVQPLVHRTIDAGFMLRVEYLVPLSESIAVSIRGNGYLVGRVSPMWGLHAFVHVGF